MVDTAIVPLIQRPGLRQFVKFCIVGASSFTLDVGTAYALWHYGHLPILLAKTISFTLAVTNGFVWNRRWTFRHALKGSRREQYPMFVSVNVVGLLLSLTIVWAAIGSATGDWSRHQHPPKLVFLLANIAATAIVVFWNFFANKHWTFRHRM